VRRFDHRRHLTLVRSHKAVDATGQVTKLLRRLLACREQIRDTAFQLLIFEELLNRNQGVIEFGDRRLTVRKQAVQRLLKAAGHRVPGGHEVRHRFRRNDQELFVTD